MTRYKEKKNKKRFIFLADNKVIFDNIVIVIDRVVVNGRLHEAILGMVQFTLMYKRHINKVYGFDINR